MKTSVTPQTKASMYRQYEAGLFGNKLRTWANLESFASEKIPPASVTLRYAGAGGGGFAAYDVNLCDVVSIADEWVHRGAERNLIRVNESAPDERLTIQGEVVRHAFSEGVGLRFSTLRGKMRDAMRHSEWVRGVGAILILRAYLTGSSYEDMIELLNIYDGAVIEFSAYEMTIGSCRGRNAVIWEVRDY